MVVTILVERISREFWENLKSVSAVNHKTTNIDLKQISKCFKNQFADIVEKVLTCIRSPQKNQSSKPMFDY